MNTEQRSNGARAEKTVACDRPAKRGAGDERAGDNASHILRRVCIVAGSFVAGRRPATPAAVARTSATASVRSPRLCVFVFVCDLRLLRALQS